MRTKDGVISSPKLRSSGGTTRWRNRLLELIEANNKYIEVNLISRGLSKNLGYQQTQAGLNRDVNQHAITQSRRTSMIEKIGSCSLNPDTALTTYTSIAFRVPVITIEQGCRHLLCAKTSSQRKSSIQIKGLLEDCVCPAFRYPGIFFHC